jgi:flagellin-like protein
MPLDICTVVILMVKKGVSAVIAVILMVAITVVLAGVLYVWVMSMANANSQKTLSVGIYNQGIEHGNLTLNVAKISQPVTIDSLTVKIVREGAAVYAADMLNATNQTVGAAIIYTSDDGNTCYIDNDMNGYVSEGDVIKISASVVHAGDRVQIVFGTRTVYVALVKAT